MDAQFGNLIIVRDKPDRKGTPGAQECFLSSVIQFQPLARIGLQGPAGPIALTPVSAASDPVCARKVFEGGGLRLAQELVVSGDEASLLLRVERVEAASATAADADAARAAVRASAASARTADAESVGRAAHNDADVGGFSFTLDGACLFSPQGVPYHWRDEKLLSLRRARDGQEGFDGEWDYGKLPFSLRSSARFDSFMIRKIGDDEIIRTHYFTSFNLKKRSTYWVDAPEKVGGTGDFSPLSARNIGYAASIDLKDLREPREFCIAFGIGGAAKKTEASGGHHARLIQKEECGWDDFLNDVPEFRADDRELERIYCTSWFVLKANRVRFDNPRFPYSFTSVNKHHYYNQFFWDSAYQAIAWLWYNRAEPAQDEMRNFVANQWRNGMIPYELFMYPVNGREWMDGDGTSTNMTQPPVIGISLSEIYKKFGDTDYLRFFYASLLRYEEWLTLYRDIGKRGLSCYLNIWETGWDNSPRLDSCARNRILDPAIESADFNAYIYFMRHTILEMAEVLGEKAPSRIAERMAATKRSMNALMYDADDKFYYDIIAGTDRRIPVKTAAGLIPLITDIPDPEARAAIVERYLESDKEFMTGCPVPSVSRSEPSYNPVDFWRGANWPQITWTVIYALADAEPETAGRILGRFLATTKANTTCYEYYDAETGAGVGMPFHGWGALYTDLIMRFVVGIVPENHGMRFRPLPAQKGDFSVENVKLKDMALAIEKKGDDWTFRFSGFGDFAMCGTHDFQVTPTADRSALTIEFAPGCPRNKVRLLTQKSGLEFRFAEN